MEFKKKQATNQGVELTKKELIEIVKDTVAKQIFAYDKKQKRARAGAFIFRFLRLLLIGGVMAAVAHFLPMFSAEDEEDIEEEADSVQ